MSSLEFFVASLQQSPDVHPPFIHLLLELKTCVAPVSPFYYSATCLPGSRLILVSLVDGLGIDFWDWFLVFSAAIVCSAENMCDGMQWFCNPVWVSLARKLASKNKMADVWKM